MPPSCRLSSRDRRRIATHPRRRGRLACRRKLPIRRDTHSCTIPAPQKPGPRWVVKSDEPAARLDQTGSLSATVRRRLNWSPASARQSWEPRAQRQQCLFMNYQGNSAQAVDTWSCTAGRYALWWKTARIVPVPGGLLRPSSGKAVTRARFRVDEEDSQSWVSDSRYWLELGASIDGEILFQGSS
jgi:hypothetical protein